MSTEKIIKSKSVPADYHCSFRSCSPVLANFVLSANAADRNPRLIHRSQASLVHWWSFLQECLFQVACSAFAWSSKGLFCLVSILALLRTRVFVGQILLCQDLLQTGTLARLRHRCPNGQRTPLHHFHPCLHAERRCPQGQRPYGQPTGRSQRLLFGA